MYRVARKRAGTDSHNTIDLREIGRIFFVLHSEVEAFILPGIPFRVEGGEVDYEGETDENGRFEIIPVEFREYDLVIGDATFRIPAVSLDAPPHPVHVAYEASTALFGEWNAPLDEEVNEDDASAGVDDQYFGIEE